MVVLQLFPVCYKLCMCCASRLVVDNSKLMGGNLAIWKYSSLTKIIDSTVLTTQPHHIYYLTEKHYLKTDLSDICDLL